VSGVERELKLRLPDEAAWRRFRDSLGPPGACLEQINLYLDTPELEVAACRGMLRLRRQEGDWSVTYKRGLQVERGYFEALEVESPWPASPGPAPDPAGLEHLPPLQALRAEGIRGALAVRGEVRNLRLRYPLPDGDVLELDRTTFPGGRVDFEVEVETLQPQRVLLTLEELARRAGVALHIQEQTKYERFLEALGQA